MQKSESASVRVTLDPKYLPQASPEPVPRPGGDAKTSTVVYSSSGATTTQFHVKKGGTGYQTIVTQDSKVLTSQLSPDQISERYNYIRSSSGLKPEDRGREFLDLTLSGDGSSKAHPMETATARAVERKGSEVSTYPRTLLAREQAYHTGGSGSASGPPKTAGHTFSGYQAGPQEARFSSQSASKDSYRVMKQFSGDALAKQILPRSTTIQQTNFEPRPTVRTAVSSGAAGTSARTSGMAAAGQPQSKALSGIAAASLGGAGFVASSSYTSSSGYNYQGLSYEARTKRDQTVNAAKKASGIFEARPQGGLQKICFVYKSAGEREAERNDLVERTMRARYQKGSAKQAHKLVEQKQQLIQELEQRRKQFYSSRINEGKLECVGKGSLRPTSSRPSEPETGYINSFQVEEPKPSTSASSSQGQLLKKYHRCNMCGGLLMSSYKTCDICVRSKPGQEQKRLLNPRREQVQGTPYVLSRVSSRYSASGSRPRSRSPIDEWKSRR